jgi:hypothetical protein
MEDTRHKRVTCSPPPPQAASTVAVDRFSVQRYRLGFALLATSKAFSLSITQIKRKVYSVIYSSQNGKSHDSCSLAWHGLVGKTLEADAMSL